MSKSKIKGITGRDNYIEAKALIYAIAMIQSLPKVRQGWSDMRDMCAIARTIPPHNLVNLIYETQGHTKTVIDIWPDHDEDLNEYERRDKHAFVSIINGHVAELEQNFAALIAAYQKSQQVAA